MVRIQSRLLYKVIEASFLVERVIRRLLKAQQAKALTTIPQQEVATSVRSFGCAWKNSSNKPQGDGTAEEDRSRLTREQECRSVGNGRTPAVDSETKVLPLTFEDRSTGYGRTSGICEKVGANKSS